MKKTNKRCPLQTECERKCEYQFKELDCEYYANNGVGEDRTIPDQEERRSRIDRERLEEQWEADLADIEDDEEPTKANENRVAGTGNTVMLPVNELYPHPDNPRKDVGDVAELVESIKANGILQNLTVVPNMVTSEITGGSWQRGYKVIIGHRRLEAAKKAGLKELPCVVVEMSEKEQLSTMLTENMQRVDLTVYEQANGFQMMFDLGDSVEQIADKSGFSKTTVRKRLEIAKLDQKTLKKVSGRQLSVGDFDELAKIDDIGVRNEVLASMGTANFKNELQTALKNQRVEKRMNEWLEVIRTFATEDPNANYQNRQYLRNYGVWKLDKDVEVPADAGTKKYYYKVCHQEIDIYTDRDTDKEDAEKAAREERERIAAELRQRWDDVNERHYDLRSDFVIELSNAVCKKNTLAINSFIANAIFALADGYSEEMNLALLGNLLGVKIDEDDFEGNGITDYSGIRSALESLPEKTLFCMAYSLSDNEYNGYFRRVWDNGAYGYQHNANPELDALYEVLVALGYEMSDEEKQMQTGEHPWFAADDDTDED